MLETVCKGAGESHFFLHAFSDQSAGTFYPRVIEQEVEIGIPIQPYDFLFQVI
jgi:hypothetical protein